MISVYLAIAAVSATWFWIVLEHANDLEAYYRDDDQDYHDYHM